MRSDRFVKEAMPRLPSKRTLITGGTSGIGLETAHQFLSEGAHVVVTGSSAESVAQAQREFGSDVLALQVDSSSVADQRRLAATLKEHYGQLDVAFINAGISIWQPMEAWTEDNFDRVFATNVKGPYFLIQALLSTFADPASVILCSSAFAHIGVPRTSVCSATKAALLSLTKTLSSELIARNVRFNAISPGPIDTPMFDRIGLAEHARDQAILEVVSRIPTKRLGRTEDVANAAVFLASNESAWTIGSEIAVDGGRLLNA